MKILKQMIKAIASILLFLNTSYSYAQVNPLRIDEKCPDKLISYLNELTGQDGLSRKLNKVILIDFWATYCAPCVAKLPFLDSLQKENEKELTIISATQQKDRSLIKEVLNKTLKTNKLTLIIGDTLLNKYFPHNTIPHYVWITDQGVVKAITNDVNRANIKKLIQNKPLDIALKTTKLKYNFKEPLYASKQAELNDELLYHSMITKYRPDVMTFDSRGDNYINAQNNSVLHLYQIAYGKFDSDFFDMNRVIATGFTNAIDSADIGIWTGEKFKLWRKNIEKNAFSYELFLPSPITMDLLFEHMQQDLNRYFSLKGIEGKLEKRSQKVMALICVDGSNYQSFKEKNLTPGNYSTPNSLKIIDMPMIFFLAKLRPLFASITMPIVNNTGYKGNVNIEINGKINDIDAINKALRNYGLKLEEKEELVDMLIISKNDFKVL